jgi:hypothetical protein
MYGSIVLCFARIYNDEICFCPAVVGSSAAAATCAAASQNLQNQLLGITCMPKQKTEKDTLLVRLLDITFFDHFESLTQNVKCIFFGFVLVFYWTSNQNQ